MDVRNLAEVTKERQKDRNDYAPVESKAALIPACPPDFHHIVLRPPGTNPEEKQWQRSPKQQIARK
jgi:hypothetical protein